MCNIVPVQRCVAALIVVAGVVSSARADDGSAAGEDELPYSPVVHGTITGGALLFYALTESVFKDATSPDVCRWCTPPGFDANLRDALKWSDTGDAEVASDTIGFIGVPVAAFGMLAAASWRDDELDQFWVDGLVVVEAAAITASLTQLVKISAGRERPFVHALPEDEKGLTDRPQDNNVSFFSGHTSYTFALANAAGAVATRRGYRGARWIWGIGVGLAATTGYLRIAADKHWTSDVVTGAALGTAVGIGVPKLLHAPRRRVEVLPMPNGIALRGTF